MTYIGYIAIFNVILALMGYNSFNLAFIASILVSFFVFKFSDTPDTWNQYIDQLLTTYNPVDKEAFHQLQVDVKAQGMTTPVLEKWFKAEQASFKKLKSENKINNPKEDVKFLKRK